MCFATIITAIEKLEPDARLLLNSAEFYGAPPHRTTGLEMLSRFFAGYPELGNRTFLSVKGAVGSVLPKPDNSEENIRKSVDTCLKALDGKKRIDLFECARVDPRYSVQDTVGILKALVDEGKIDHIGLSECAADTLRRANTIHPVTAAEIEISPWSYEEETKKVIAVSKELNVTVVAYSPIGRGYLTGQYQPSDFKDFRSGMERVNDQNREHNFKFVRSLGELAEKKGISPAQLCIAWVASLGGHVVPIPGSSRPQRAEENTKAAAITLTKEDLEDITKLMDSHVIRGGRYFGGTVFPEHLWMNHPLPFVLISCVL